MVVLIRMIGMAIQMLPPQREGQKDGAVQQNESTATKMVRYGLTAIILSMIVVHWTIGIILAWCALATHDPSLLPWYR